MSNNIEEDIKELRDSYELHQSGWAKRYLDNIEKELKKLQSKANKYDSLVEKIKEKLNEKELIKRCETIADREHLDGEIFALQELLEEGEKE